MAVTHGRYWHIGMDRRRTKGSPYRSWVLNDYDCPASTPISRWGSAYSGMTSIAARPYCLTSAPFATDNLGQSFPAGTLWVIVNPVGGSTQTLTGLRGPGTTTNPLTGGFSLSTYTGCALDFIYSAYGIPSGASVTVQVKGATTNTVYATFSPTINGASLFYEVPTFTPSTTDTNLNTTTTWTGGTPITEGFGLHPLCLAAMTAVAVPGTLPAGYTLRLNSDNNRGGSYDKRSGYDGGRRLRAGPYTTFETMGLAGVGGGNPAAALGVPGWAVGGGVWISGVLYSYPWSPKAVGRTTYSAQASYIAGQTGTTSTFTSYGVRYCQVSFSYQKFQADPGPTDTFTWTITQDGTTIGSGTVTGSAIKSIATQTITTTLPSPGVSTVIQIGCTGSGGTTFGQPNWECSATVAGSPRCDIPLPYTCVGPGNIGAPGGYWPALLASPVNSQPITRASASATSIAFGASAGTGAFTPATDGWWQVLKSGSAQSYIGEDEFGWQDLRTIRRGRAGRPFHCRSDNGGTLFLTPYAPPSPTVIAGGGTTLTLDAGGWIAWCSVTFPTTATYRVTFALQGNAIQSGMVVETSKTDPGVINPNASYTWEPFQEAGNMSFQGTGITNAPPGSPVSEGAYIVGGNPTGAWAGKANAIAVWDTYFGQWIFVTPVAGSYLRNVASGGQNYWFDGTAWHTTADPQLTVTVAAHAGDIMFFTVSPFSTEVGSPGQVIVGFATP